MIDMNEIMKKAQELSENMKQQQEELAKQTFAVSVGGEMVKTVSYTHLTLPTIYSV